MKGESKEETLGLVEAALDAPQFHLNGVNRLELGDSYDGKAKTLYVAPSCGVDFGRRGSAYGHSRNPDDAG